MTEINPDTVTTKTMRDITRSQIIAEGLREKKTWTEIAANAGISRQHLYAEIRENPELKGLILAEITDMETRLKSWIDTQLHIDPDNPVNPANQRLAVQELGKMIRHSKDKAYPTIFQHQTLTVDLTQQELNTWRQTIRTLPPTIRQQVMKQYQTIKQNQQTPQYTQ